MKIKKIFFLIVFCSCIFSLTGCNNGDLDKANLDMYIQNKLVSERVEEYEKNMDAYNKLGESIYIYLFQEEKGMPNFINNESLFYNYDEICNELDTIHQKLYNVIKKEKYDREYIKKNTEYYSFFDEENGAIIGYYVIPMNGNTWIVEVYIQNGTVIDIQFQE